MRSLAVILVLTLCFGIIALHVTAATGHGCAPPVPPGVPGSPVPAPATPGIVVLNEVLLQPHSTWNCSESGRYFITTDSWIELYNPQNRPFNLYAAHASIDSGPNTNKYTLPFGAAIATHSFLVLFPRTNPWFYLTETPTLRFVISGVVIDQVVVPTLGLDQSYARTYDGGPTWQITNTPTIDASNSSSQVNPTPTPTPTASSHSSHGDKNTSGGGGNKGLNNGTQPQWANLQLPSATATPTVNLPPTTILSTVPPTIDGFDFPRRIILTVLIVSLALALFWCWRLFKRA